MVWVVVSLAGFAVETLLVVVLGRSVTAPYEAEAGLAPAAPPAGALPGVLETGDAVLRRPLWNAGRLGAVELETAGPGGWGRWGANP
ncbi:MULTISPECIES: hypothetical protein [unclassified Blastococcus]